MDLNFTNLFSEVEGKELKEWRSRKDFDEYVMEKERWGIIGYVSHKTLKRWGRMVDWREWRNEESMYVLQVGREYYYVAFRRGGGFLSKTN